MPYMDETNLTTVQKVVDWCKINNSEGNLTSQIERLIEAVSSTVSQEISTDQYVFARTITETQNGNGRHITSLNATPVNSITSVFINGVEIKESVTFNGLGYKFDGEFLYLVGGYVFERGYQNIVIELNAGISTTSTEAKSLEQAVLEWINLKWHRKDHPDKLMAKNRDMTTEQFTVADAPAEVKSVIRLIRSKITPAPGLS